MELVVGEKRVWEWMVGHKYNMLLQKRINAILRHLKKPCILETKQVK